jgi:hypothetical protein
VRFVIAIPRDLKAERARFNKDVAPLLAEQAVPRLTQMKGPSGRFAWFGDSERYVVVAGVQEDKYVGQALAYGLDAAADRELILILPEGRHFATEQRTAFLRARRQPRLLLHDAPWGGTTRTVREQRLPSRDRAVQRVQRQIGSDAALLKSMTAIHLGSAGRGVEDLVEWATSHPDLAPAHRPGERAWQCNGLRVLTIARAAGGLVIKAGVHYSDAAKAPTIVPKKDGGLLPDAKRAEITSAVAAGIAARLGGKHRLEDEHWLQSVIRARPELVGVEQPALRELPAWRPASTGKTWGRGFIDLLGLDGSGDIRIVETKLSRNKDVMLILQGVDYYAWAQAARGVLLQRLGAHAKARTEVHYVLGSSAGKISSSPFLKGQLDALDIPYRFQTVASWFPDTAAAVGALLPKGSYL